jgi:S-adenosylmethionine-diacylgycerolhomoserine-N-methlytransferase
VLATDAKVLWQLLRGQARSGSHAERLQAFYAPQAGRYDVFRERLLHGRGELIAQVAPPPGSRVVELGGGTGRNLLFFGDRLAGYARFDLVDLCPALLAEARKKAQALPNVHVTEADATRWRPSQPADLVYFSYSLTMIPDWRAAIDNAWAMLAPGGRIGVVDFFVSQPRPPRGRQRHGAATRWFWRCWFGHDGVFLDPAHLDYLAQRFPDHALSEHRGGVPYLPGLRVPYYRFVGRKGAAS